MFTTILYSLKKAPIVPANSPSALNTTVKPSTKLSALKKNFMLFYPILLQNMRYTVAKAAAYRGK